MLRCSSGFAVLVAYRSVVFYCDFEYLTVLLSLTAALLFATGIQFARLGLEHTDPRTGALTQIGAATVLYWLCAPFFIEAQYWLSPAVALLAAIGLFRPFLSANLSMAGTKLLGPTISSTLSSTAPLFAIVLPGARPAGVPRADNRPQGGHGRSPGGAERGADCGKRMSRGIGVSRPIGVLLFNLDYSWTRERGRGRLQGCRR